MKTLSKSSNQIRLKLNTIFIQKCDHIGPFRIWLQYANFYSTNWIPFSIELHTWKDLLKPPKRLYYLNDNNIIGNYIKRPLLWEYNFIHLYSSWSSNSGWEVQPRDPTTKRNLTEELWQLLVKIYPNLT